MVTIDSKLDARNRMWMRLVSLTDGTGSIGVVGRTARNLEVKDVNLLGAWLAPVVFVLILSMLFVGAAVAQQNGSGRVGLPHDWSHHYVIFTDNAPPDIVAHPELAAQLQNDPRFLAHVIKSNVRRQAALAGQNAYARSKHHKNDPKIDWSKVNLEALRRHLT